MSGASDFQLYLRMLRTARPYRYHIVGLFLLSLLSTPLALLGPVPLKIAVDSVIGSDPLPGVLKPFFSSTSSPNLLLGFAAGLLLAIALLGGLQDLAKSMLRTYTGENLLLEFRAQLFHKAQRLSLSYHDSKGSADATYRIFYDAASLQYVAIDGVIPFFSATLTLATMLYVTARLDWKLTLIALAITPLLFVIARIYRRQLRAQSRKIKRLDSTALSVVQEVLSALRVVKAFGRESGEQARMVRHSTHGMQARFRLSLSEGTLGLLLGLVTATGTAAVLFIGVRHVQTGLLTLGNLLLVMSYLSQLYGPIKTISKKVASLQSHLASAERAFAVLDEQPDVVERPHARRLDRAQGAVAFRDVSFAYFPDQPVLSNVSFDVPAGTRVGIAGRTGAGKTTLVNLLTRFYDPTSGQITLDGVDLREYKVADLRNQFAIVLQEPVLFSTSIAENIAYARPEATHAEIQRAAQAANANEFICRLPDGYETLVGERGMRLSGGERQRVALARAFLKDAPILILDEPTSSVDTVTETQIMDAMERLMQGRTTFMIAHRRSTLENCDVLMEVESGRLSKLVGVS